MKVPTYYALLFVMITSIFGCSENEGPTPTTGRLNVFMVDAPFPTDMVKEATVTVFKVDARMADSNKEEDMGEDGMTGEGPTAPGGFVPLMENEVTLNLLDLVGGVSEQLVSSDIPVGCYDLIRVYVRGVQVVLKDDTVFQLDVPSGAQTGIKVFMEPCIEVAGGLSSDLLLDFDVSRSFVPKGSLTSPNGIEGFNFTPVIRGSNLSTTGTLWGTVTYQAEADVPEPLQGAMITIYNPDETELASTQTDSEGNYEISGVDAGSYRVEVTLEGFIPQSVDGIEVVAGNRTNQDFIMEAEVMPDE